MYMRDEDFRAAAYRSLEADIESAIWDNSALYAYADIRMGRHPNEDHRWAHQIYVECFANNWAPTPEQEDFMDDYVRDYGDGDQCFEDVYMEEYMKSFRSIAVSIAVDVLWDELRGYLELTRDPSVRERAAEVLSGAAEAEYDDSTEVCDLLTLLSGLAR